MPLLNPLSDLTTNYLSTLSVATYFACILIIRLQFKNENDNCKATITKQCYALENGICVCVKSWLIHRHINELRCNMNVFSLPKPTWRDVQKIQLNVTLIKIRLNFLARVSSVSLKNLIASLPKPGTARSRHPSCQYTNNYSNIRHDRNEQLNHSLEILFRHQLKFKFDADA